MEYQIRLWNSVERLQAGPLHYLGKSPLIAKMFERYEQERAAMLEGIQEAEEYANRGP